MSARERLAYEQAERVRTAQLIASPRAGANDGPAKGRPTDDRSGDDRAASAKPWIVVGIVAVLALIASILIVTTARTGTQDPEPGSAPTTQEQTTTTSPTTSEPGETQEPETEEPDENRVPSVEVGPTTELRIEAWGATSQLSTKFGMTSYTIPDNVNLVLSSPLIDQLPPSCAAMRDQWGATRLENGTFTVRKPAERCEAAPELYDELWGLTAAFVESIAPM